MVTSSGSSGSDDDLAPGTLVGEYRIERKLGAGGMGVVFAAVHPVIGKRAAIKVLSGSLSSNAEAVDRFVGEARAVNRIGHPNIVDIFSFGSLPDGRNYFVMELLSGASLRDTLDRGRLPRDVSLAIVDGIIDALEAAHAKGIIHRDLKPDNVFLVDKGDDAPHVKLLDFGIAKLLGEQAPTHTRTGSMLGTPAYMSPEQARGHAIDARTDVYALGAMMFELFTGELVFPADNLADMLARHLLEPPPPMRSVDPSLPVPLDELVVRMLVKEPARRPWLAEVHAGLRSARESLAPAVEHVASPPQRDSVVVAAAPSRDHSIVAPAPRRWAVIAVTAIATFAVGAGAFFALRGGARTPVDAGAPPIVLDASIAVIDAPIDVATIDAVDAPPLPPRPPPRKRPVRPPRPPGVPPPTKPPTTDPTTLGPGSDADAPM